MKYRGSPRLLLLLTVITSTFLLFHQISSEVCPVDLDPHPCRDLGSPYGKPHRGESLCACIDPHTTHRNPKKIVTGSTSTTRRRDNDPDRIQQQESSEAASTQQTREIRQLWQAANTGRQAGRQKTRGSDTTTPDQISRSWCRSPSQHQQATPTYRRESKGRIPAFKHADYRESRQISKRVREGRKLYTTPTFSQPDCKRPQQTSQQVRRGGPLHPASTLTQVVCTRWKQISPQMHRGGPV